MNTYSIYDLTTGLFTGVVIRCGSDHLDINIPEGCSCIVGEYDSRSQRVETGYVVDYIPEQPSLNHVWDDETKRWVYVKTDSDFAADIKRQRDLMLSETDWVVAKSTELDEPVPKEWKVYRKALRDITSQKGFPRDVEWPVKPS